MTKDQRVVNMLMKQHLRSFNYTNLLNLRRLSFLKIFLVSCITICWVLRKLFRHILCRFPRKLLEDEAVKPNVQTSPEGPSNVYAMKQTSVRILHDSNQKPTENTAKT